MIEGGRKVRRIGFEESCDDLLGSDTADQTVVFSMRPNPKPGQVGPILDRHRAVMKADSN